MLFIAIVVLDVAKMMIETINSLNFINCNFISLPIDKLFLLSFILACTSFLTFLEIHLYLNYLGVVDIILCVIKYLEVMAYILLHILLPRIHFLQILIKNHFSQISHFLIQFQSYVASMTFCY